MTRQEFIALLDEKLRLVRAEANFTQEQMAAALGLSKKTVVEIEKGRSSLGWAGAGVLCTLFGGGEMLTMTFGGAPQEVVMALAFGTEERRPNARGGRGWWVELAVRGGYRLQQNLISRHYRILDAQDRRICSSFELAPMEERLRKLSEAAEK